jgi:hypothetical protein
LWYFNIFVDNHVAHPTRLKKLSSEIENWVFDVAERLALNPAPKNSRKVANSPYMRIKPDRQIDSMETKQYKAVQPCRVGKVLFVQRLPH